MVIRRLPLDSELYHHGIKGQKWGVRRYQNYDGSLTSTGRRKYGVNDKMVILPEDSKVTQNVKRNYNQMNDKELSDDTGTLNKYYKEMEKSRTAYAGTLGSILGGIMTLPFAVMAGPAGMLPHAAITGAAIGLSSTIGTYHDKKAKDVIKNMNAKQKKYYNDFVKIEDKYENDEMDYDTFIKKRKDLLNESSKQ